jgi:hypothetical protein
VTFSSAADKKVLDAATALSDTLNKLEISTIKIQTNPEGLQMDLQFRGADSPEVLARKDPTAVILLVGTNPMFDLAGWKKKHHK